MYMSNYKKWTLISASIFTVLWIVFYFLFFYPENDVSILKAVFHLVILLCNIPLAYLLEKISVAIYRAVYSKNYLSLVMVLNRIFLPIVLIVVLFIIFQRRSFIEVSFYLLLWDAFWVSVIITDYIGSLEANKELFE